MHMHGIAILYPRAAVRTSLQLDATMLGSDLKRHFPLFWLLAGSIYVFPFFLLAAGHFLFSVHRLGGWSHGTLNVAQCGATIN